MKGRIPANSESLKKHFPEVYKEFFSTHQLILSAPLHMFWNGENTLLEGGTSLIQNLPLRIYVAIEPTNSQSISLGNYAYFSRRESKFIIGKIDEPARSRILYILNNFLPFNIKNSGINVDILCEGQPGGVFAVSTALSAALSVGLFLYFKKISLVDISMFDQYSNPMSNNNNAQFDEIFRFAWKIRCANRHDEASSGAQTFASFKATFYPILYLTEPQNPENFLDNFTNGYKNIEKTAYWGSKLEEICKIKYATWPIDFGLISFGKRYGIMGASATLIGIKNILKQYSLIGKTFLKKIYIKTKSDLLLTQLSTKKSSINYLWNIYANMLCLNAFQSLLNFKSVFSEYNKYALENLFESLNNSHSLSNMVRTISEESDRVAMLTKEIFGLTRNSIGAVKAIGNLGFPEILFACQHRLLREDIDKLLNQLSQKIKMPVQLDYASWLDGLEGEAIKVEQDLKNKVYSGFVSEGTIQIKQVSPNGNIITHVLTKEDFTTQKGKMALLMDCVNQEIYIKGQEISSRYIPSTKTTLKVMQILLGQLGKEVKSTVFGKKSYFVDRNEFQSKIVSPLTKAAKKRLKKGLPIEIHGSLDEFTVKLSQPQFDIHIIEKVF